MVSSSWCNGLLVMLVGLGGTTIAVAQPNDPPDTMSLARQALRSNSPDRQRAALAALEEMPARALVLEGLRLDLLRYVRLSRDTESRASALRSLGRSRVDPEDAVEVGALYLGQTPVEMRRAVGGLMVESAKGVAAKLGRPQNIPPEPAVELATGSVIWGSAREPFTTFNSGCRELLGVAKTALQDSDPDVRDRAAETCGILSDALVTVLPDPNVIRESERIVKPDEARRAWKVLQSGMTSFNDVSPALAGSLQTSPSLPTVRAVRSIAQARRAALATRTFEEAEYHWGAHPRNPFQTGIATLLPATTSALKSNSQEVRLTAMEAIESMEQDALPEVSSVVSASQDRDPFVRWVSARAMGKMVSSGKSTPDSEAAVAGLSGMLRDADVDVRSAALNSLMQCGDRAKSSFSAVAQTIGRGDPEVRVSAIRTLESLKGDPTETVAALLPAINNPDVRVKRAAITALGRLGTRAKAATPDLQRMLKDEDADVRRNAAEALLQIDRGM